jgi:CheY-like chemotaxis protein
MPIRSPRREVTPSYRAAVSTPLIDAETTELVVDETRREEMGVDDDRGRIEPGDRVVLIVEDDPSFAQIMLDISHEKGFKGIVAPGGLTAIAMARELKPDAITLDLHLPDLDGRRVLDRLKMDWATRHIPVEIITVDSVNESDLMHGALAYVTKSEKKESMEQAFDELKDFVSRPVKNLLVVEDDEIQRMSISEIIGNGDVHTTLVGSGREALDALATQHFDCMVLDLGLPDMSGVGLLEEIKKQTRNRRLPVIIYTAKDLLQEESAKLKQLAETIVIKDDRSPERLLDETALFLHRNVARLPDKQRKMLEYLHHGVLEGKRVLLVDDDIRNIFAMTSVLERFKMNVISAENGKEAIEKLVETGDVDIVLMDIMLPTMDGYATTRAIREISGFENLPIVAVTAKAMKGDREKCIAAGASDYLSKPVDTEQLRSILRLWLCQ